MREGPDPLTGARARARARNDITCCATLRFSSNCACGRARARKCMASGARGHARVAAARRARAMALADEHHAVSERPIEATGAYGHRQGHTHTQPSHEAAVLRMP